MPPTLRIADFITALQLLQQYQAPDAAMADYMSVSNDHELSVCTDRMPHEAICERLRALGFTPTAFKLCDAVQFRYYRMFDTNSK